MRPSEVALCALLAEARRQAEKGQEDILGLREYLLALPSDFSTLPLNFSQEEANMQLRGTVLPLALHALWEKLESDRELAVAALGERLQSVWSRDTWYWAKSAVMTRAGICSTSSSASPATGGDHDDSVVAIGIVPLVDFANCAANPSAFCRADADCIELVVARSLSAGSEVTISYGSQCQEQQLFTFGFALPESPTEVLAPLSISVDDQIVDAGEDSAIGHDDKSAVKALQLRAILLKLLYLERKDESEASNAYPPLARLKSSSASVDVSEMVAVANLLDMSEAELKEVVAHVKTAGALPEKLRTEASLGALKHLTDLLQDWLTELTLPVSSPKNPRFEAARHLRAQTVAVAQAALQEIHARELRAAASLGASL